MAQRELLVRILGDDRSLSRALTNSSRGAKNFDRDMKGATSRAQGFNQALRGVLSTTGKSGFLFGSGAFVATASLTAAVTASSKVASNLAEQTSKAEVVFGRASRTVEDFAKNALGLANDQALETASTFGALLRPLGLLPEAAANLSVEMTKLGVDLASFSNTPVQDALDAIRSGLIGEQEPLRRYGVLLSEARVKQEALRETGKTSAKALTNQEKVLARVALITRDAAQASGDYERTIGGLANQQRELAKNIRNLEGAIGTALNPAILDVTTSLNKWLGQSENQEKVQKAVADAVGAVGTTLKVLKTVLGPVVSAVGGLRHAFELVLALGLVAKLRAISIALGLSSGAGMAGSAGRAAKGVTALARALAILQASVAIGGLRATALSVAGLATNLAKIGALGVIGVEIVIAQRFEGGDPLGLKNFIQGVKGRDWSKILTGDTGVIGRLFAQPAPGRSVQGESGSKVPLDRQFAAALAAAKARGRKGLTAAQRNTFFDNAIARLLDRVQDSTLRDQITKLQKIASLITARIAVTKDITRKLTLEDRLLDVRRAIKGVRGDIADNLKAAAEDAKRRAQDALDAAKEAQQKLLEARNARQFFALGLSPTGGERTPNIAGLRRQLGNFEDAVKGTFLDTKKTRSLMATIRGILGKGMKGVSDEVRATIRDMLRDLNQQLKNAGDIQTKFQSRSVRNLLRAAGLDPEAVKKASFALSVRGPGGTIPGSGVGAFGFAGGAIVVQHTTMLDGRVIERSVTKHQQKRRQANPTQKRGVNR